MFSIYLDQVKHPTEFAIQKYRDCEPTKRLSCDVRFDGWSPNNRPPALKGILPNRRCVSKIQQKESVTETVLSPGSQMKDGFIFDAHAVLV